MTAIRTANHALATATPGKVLNIALWTLQATEKGVQID